MKTIKAKPVQKKRIIAKIKPPVGKKIIKAKLVIHKTTVICDNNSCKHNSKHGLVRGHGQCMLDAVTLTKHWVGSEKHYTLKCGDAVDTIK